MPFIGKQPKVGAYQLIDSITTSATATYALTVDGSAYFPASARNLIVSLNGVTQAPESAYTVSGSNIVFDSALTASDVIDYILVIGDAVDIGTPSDGTVGTSQMSYPLGNFSSTGIDDNATSTAITIDSSQKVGIGITPATILHTNVASGNNEIRQGVGGTARGQLISSDTDQYLVNLGSGNQYFYNGGSPVVTLTNGGNVGIGETDPKATLDVSTGTTLSQATYNGQIKTGVYSTDGNLDSGIEWQVRGDGSGYGFRAININAGTSGNQWRLQSRDNSATWTDNIIVDGGRVGINNSDPDEDFHVIGTVAAQGEAATSRVETITGAHDFWSTPSYSGVISQYDGTARTGTTYGITNANLGAIRFQNCSNALIGTNGSTPLIFATVSAERMRIDPSGNLNIGATSNLLTANAAGKINVLADHGGDCFNMKSTTSGNNMVNLWSTGTTSNAAIKFYKGNTQVGVGSIFTSTTATTYSTTSDYRLKENVVSLENATDRLKQIPVHRFNFIADPDTTVDGFLAHEVADIVPQAVTGTKDAVDEEGNPDYQGIDHSKLVPLLVATVQELEARIAALEAN